MHGVRFEPTSEVNYPPRHGPAAVPLPADRIGVDRGHPVVGIGAVVGRPHHDRVVRDPQLVELVEDHAGEVVHSGEHVGPVPARGRPGVLGVGDRRDVDLCVRQVQVERFAVIFGSAHELGRPLGDLAVEPGPEPGVVGGDHLGLLLLPGVDRLRFEADLRVAGAGCGGHRSVGEVRLHRPQDLVGGARAPHGLVESEVDRAPGAGVAAQVPSTPTCRWCTRRRRVTARSSSPKRLHNGWEPSDILGNIRERRAVLHYSTVPG